MPREEFDELLTTAFDKGEFEPQNENDMAVVSESQLRIAAERGELETQEGKSHYDAGAIVWDVDFYTVLQ